MLYFVERLSIRSRRLPLFGCRHHADIDGRSSSSLGLSGVACIGNTAQIGGDSERPETSGDPPPANHGDTRLGRPGPRSG